MVILIKVTLLVVNLTDNDTNHCYIVVSLSDGDTKDSNSVADYLTVILDAADLFNDNAEKEDKEPRLNIFVVKNN